MGLSGSQKALMFAQGGVARGGATRGGYHSAKTFIAINGTPVAFARSSVTYQSIVDSLLITDTLDEQPNRCAFSILGFIPTTRMEVIVTLGSVNTRTRRFAGHILEVQQRYLAGQPANVVRQVSAADYTWLLGFKRVTTQYRTQSATAIAQALISTYAAGDGFTAVHVAAGLPTIDEITYTNEELPEALTRLAKRIGGYWYVDYHKDLHFFLTEAGNEPVALTAQHASLSELVGVRDDTQLVTRAIVDGMGSLVAATAPPGALEIYVSDLTPFNAGGGQFLAPNGQIVTYTAHPTQYGSSVVAARPKPTTACTIADGGDGGGSGFTGTFVCRVLFEYADGSFSACGPISNEITLGANRILSATNIPLGGTGVVARRVCTCDPTTFVPTGSGIRVPDNTRTSFATATNTGGAYSTTDPAYVTGNTRIFVADVSVFNGSGGSLEAVATSQTLTYTGRAASTGLEALTGIPASGGGAIAATLAIGTSLAHINDSRLTGIPASGAGAIVREIPEHSEIFLRVVEDDTAAQATLAGDVGGDGIVEDHDADHRISADEATARALAMLALRSAGESKISYRCRDLRTKAGKTITVIDRPASVLALAPGGAWRVGETSGTQAVDYSGNARHLTYTGGYTLEQVGAMADGNPAVALAGSGYLTGGDISAFEFAAAFSVEISVKFTGTSGMICTKALTTPAGWGVYNSAGKIAFFANTAAGATVFFVETDSLYNDGRWHHVVVTWDGTTNANGVKIYVDGGLVKQGTASAGTIAANAAPFLIGAWHSTPTDFFTGSVDDPAVYPVALTATQIVTLYAQRLMSVASGVYQIQDVAIAGFSDAGRVYPTCTVQASTTRFTFEHLLRRARKAA